MRHWNFFDYGLFSALFAGSLFLFSLSAMSA